MARKNIITIIIVYDKNLFVLNMKDGNYSCDGRHDNDNDDDCKCYKS